MRRIVEVEGTGRPALGQVPLQGQRAGVEAVGGQLFAQRHDRDDDLVADRRGGCWPGVAIGIDRL